MNGCIKMKGDKDCRAISEPFLKEFMEGGLYYEFVKLVKEQPELELCFRGNTTTGGRVCIYRNNHAVFSIAPQTIYFNTAYLKHSSNGDKILRMLIEDYKFNNGKAVDYNQKIYSNYSIISRKADAEIMKNIKEIYLNELKDVFDNYLAKGKIKLEKKRQQELFRTMREQKNGYYFYDMEYQQRHDSKVEQDKARVNGESNKPDMQAIRFGKDGKPEALVFVEVKCTSAAYNGKSGIIKHIRGMRNYSERYMDSRRREAFLLLNQYEKLGLREFERKIIEDEYQQLPEKLEHILIFTDEARKKWEKDERPEILEIKENQVVKEIPLEDGTVGLLVCV